MTTPPANWNPTLLQTVRSALITVGALQEGENPGPDDLNEAVYKVQNWIKAQQASGLHVWTEEECILFLQAGQPRYLLGGGTTDHCCDAYGYGAFQLASTAGAGANSVSITVLSPVTPNPTFIPSVGDNIGVVLDSGIAFWTTVSSIAGTVLGLTAPLPTQASAGAMVFDYPTGTDIPRPLDIPKARYITWQGCGEVPMTRYARQQYMDLPNKNNPGAPVNWTYIPSLGQGQLFLWNVAANAGIWGFRGTYYRSIGDWMTNTTTSDFPQEWAAAIEWNLAEELMVGYDVPPPRAQMITAMATKHLAIVQGYDREAEDIQFGIQQVE
jgi:hypothetical protein